MGNKFIIMLLGFSLIINGIFMYKLNEDRTTQQINVESIRTQVKEENKESMDALEKELKQLKNEKEQTSKNPQTDTETENKNSSDTVEKTTKADLEKELKEISTKFTEGYLSFDDLYSESRKTNLLAVATEEVVSRLIPSISQKGEVTEQGVSDMDVVIQSEIQSMKIYLGDYDEDLETAEVMVDVDYTTTVDGNENKTRNLFIIKIENVNEKKMVTEFSYQTLV